MGKKAAAQAKKKETKKNLNPKVGRAGSSSGVKEKDKNKKAAEKTVRAAKTHDLTASPAPEESDKIRPAKSRARVTAEQMGELQREISISEFFTKNRHLLGFDNASRALLTSVKEAVDNSLDACEEAGIFPDIIIRIDPISENRFQMTVEDNGPGIVKAQVPKVFGKLLYGSKFHRLRQSRGQQGIGISAAGMYGQLTTGKPLHVTSKTAALKPAHHYQLVIDTTQNKPVIVHEGEDDSAHWKAKDSGTSVTIEMEAVYKGGKKSIDEYVQQVAFANPHARIEYWAPGKKPMVYPRVTQQLPPETKEIKPHPYGVELGMLMRMAQATSARNLSGFLQREFSRVSSQVADEIAKTAGVPAETSLKDLQQSQIEAVYKAIGQTKIMSPPTNCLAPIGELAMIEGLKALLVQQHFAEEEAKARRKEEEESANKKVDPNLADKIEDKITQALQQVGAVTAEPDTDEEEDEREEGDEKPTAKEIEGEVTDAEPGTGIINVFGHKCFVTAVTRPPKVYRGNPFQVEAALAYGGELPAEDLAQVYRFANRVPLLYQAGACAMTQSVVRTNWKSYDVEQARGALPAGPLLVLVHIASVWVPFTSEAKEAVAHYDEIITELKYALQECGRRLSRHIRRRRRAADEEKKARYIEKYIPHIGQALQDILGLTDKKRDDAVDKLTVVLERSRKL